MPLKTGIPVLQGGEDVKPTREPTLKQWKRRALI